MDNDKLVKAAKAVLEHLARVNEWIRDTGCVPDDTARLAGR